MTLLEFIDGRLSELRPMLEQAYADGTSESDYLEGCIDAYEIVRNKVSSAP